MEGEIIEVEIEEDPIPAQRESLYYKWTEPYEYTKEVHTFIPIPPKSSYLLHAERLVTNTTFVYTEKNLEKRIVTGGEYARILEGLVDFRFSTEHNCYQYLTKQYGDLYKSVFLHFPFFNLLYILNE